jgi:endonuclease YncB( thermonuclease family)
MKTVSRSALSQALPNNSAMRFQSSMTPAFAHAFAAHRHHHYWNNSLADSYALGSYGLAGTVVGVQNGNTLTIQPAANSIVGVGVGGGVGFHHHHFHGNANAVANANAIARTNVNTNALALGLAASGGIQRVRMFGVAAPTAAQFSVPSTEHLSNYLVGKFVHVHQMGRDADGTIVGKVFLGGSYVNEGRINHGFAWYNMNDGYDPVLAQAEEHAQEANAGLWGKADPAGMWLSGQN